MIQNWPRGNQRADKKIELQTLIEFFNISIFFLRIISQKGVTFLNECVGVTFLNECVVLIEGVLYGRGGVLLFGGKGCI